jgi:hypothetical protein
MEYVAAHNGNGTFSEVGQLAGILLQIGRSAEAAH